MIGMDNDAHHVDSCKPPYTYKRLPDAKVSGIVKCEKCGLISWEEAAVLTGKVE